MEDLLKFYHLTTHGLRILINLSVGPHTNKVYRV